jgi:hypothetical protein
MADDAMRSILEDPITLDLMVKPPTATMITIYLMHICILKYELN